MRRRVALAVVAALAVAARVPTLSLRRIVEGDGVHYASIARDILHGEPSALATPYWSTLWPNVIAATSLATGLDVVAAARVASVAAGALTAVLTASLAWHVLDFLAGLLAGLAVAVHPWLVHFSSLVFTESLFSCLLVGLLLVGWTAARADRPWPLIGMGLVAALAVLTRPEAFLATAAATVPALAAGRRRAGLPGAARNAALVLAGLVPLLVVRALLTYEYFDYWDVGGLGKGTVNLVVGLAGDDATRERLATRVAENGRTDLDAMMREWSLAGFVWSHPSLVLTHTLRNLREVPGVAWRVLPPLPVHAGRDAFSGALGAAIDPLAAASLALGLVGLGAGLARPATRGGTLLVGSVLVLYLVGLAPFFLHDRLVVAYAPLFLVLFAHGLATTLRAGARRCGAGERAAGGAALFVVSTLGALSVAGVLRSPSLPYGGDPPVQEEAGLWLRRRYSQDHRLMAATPAIAFYFYDVEHEEGAIDFPWLGGGGLLEFARRHRVDLVAASEWHLSAAHHPARDLADPQRPHPGLEYLATLGVEPPYRVHVYRLQPAGGTFENRGQRP